MPHEYGDKRIANWLRANQYHPRSPAHGSASCMYFLDDLLHESDLFREAAKGGEIVYQEDHTVGSDQARWNTDLVIGPPESDEVQTDLDEDRLITEAKPGRVWLGIDAKSVMTEHQKAQRNRQRDINSFADIIHRHHPGAVTGGIILVNIANRFRSPLRDEGDITEHEGIEELVEETIEIFRDIDRANGEISANVDGVGCVVVDHTNIDDGHSTHLVTDPPAPQRGDIVHYRDFLEIIIETLESRFLQGEIPEPGQAQRLDLRSELNDRVLELAHHTFQLGRDLDAGEVTEEEIERVRETIESVEAIVDQVADKHEG